MDAAGNNVLTLFKFISDKQLERHGQSAEDSNTAADEEVMTRLPLLGMKTWCPGKIYSELTSRITGQSALLHLLLP